MTTQHTPGPWQVTIQRFEGVTTYRPMTHCETSIAVHPKEYWPDGYQPPVDDYGYFQPDENMDCDEHRIANARLIAAAPALLEALARIVDWNTRTLDSGLDAGRGITEIQLHQARAAIAKATGATS